MIHLKMILIQIHLEKYDPKSTKKIELYAFIQFIALSFVGLIVLESGIFEYSELCIIIGMMAFTMFCTPHGWMEKVSQIGIIEIIITHDSCILCAK